MSETDSDNGAVSVASFSILKADASRLANDISGRLILRNLRFGLLVVDVSVLGRTFAPLKPIQSADS